ncbi:MAG: tetratricopeptide repeat protein [Elusimicrobia bacterium]|nr:tetratricopeptide repeat protein [Elusimicrobiota bacterium]
MNRKLKYILTVLLFILAVVFLIRTITGYDVWWHLKTGEYIVKNLAIPRTDIFSIPAYGNQWMDLHWFFQVILYIFYAVFGISGPILLQMLCILTLLILLFRFYGQDDNFLLRIFLIFLLLVAISTRFIIRPEMVSYILLFFCFSILYEYKYNNRDYLWFLPVIQLIWVNSHSLFVLGLVLMFSYLIGELLSAMRPKFLLPDRYRLKGKKYRRLAGIFSVSVIICFINPFTYKGVIYPYTLFVEIGGWARKFMPGISEFIPPFSHPEILLQSMPLICYIILISVSAVFIVLNIRRIDFSHFLVYVIFLYFSVLTIRNTAIFAIVAVPITVINANQFFANSNRNFAGTNVKVNIIKNISAGVLALIISGLIYSIVTNRYYIRERDYTRFGWGVSQLVYPEKAVDFVNKKKISGNFYNSADIGGYLIWRFYPERKVLFDMRVEIYGLGFAMHWNECLQDFRRWEQLADRYGVNFVLINHNSFEAEQILPELARHKNWELVYFDEITSVFIRNLPENHNIIKSEVLDFSLSQESFKKENFSLGILNKARFFHLIGRIQEAEYIYRETLKAFPEYYEIYFALGILERRISNWPKAIENFRKALAINSRYPPARFHLAEALYYLGNVYYNSGNFAEAQKSYEESIRFNPGFALSYSGLGNVYKKKGLINKAVEFYERALAIDPFSARTHFKLGYAYEDIGMYIQAIEHYKKAIQFSSGYVQAHFNLGNVYMSSGMLNEAIKKYKKVIQLNPKFAGAYYHLGWIYKEKGDYKSAVKNWEKYLELNPGSPEAEVLRIEISAIKSRIDTHE